MPSPFPGMNPIPLRKGTPDVKLDLQEVAHHIYDAARYETWIYRSEPQPALRGADAAWAQEILAQVSQG